MRDKPIEFVEIRYKSIPYKVQDHWKFVPTGRFQWLQRYAWKLLHKLGGLTQAYSSTEKATRHVIDPDHFMGKLFKQKQAIVQMLHKEGQTLLIGAEDFQEMMSHAQALEQSFSFIGSYNIDRTIVGLKVQIIPWMRGMLVMP